MAVELCSDAVSLFICSGLRTHATCHGHDARDRMKALAANMIDIIVVKLANSQLISACVNIMIKLPSRKTEAFAKQRE